MHVFTPTRNATDSPAFKPIFSYDHVFCDHRLVCMTGAYKSGGVSTRFRNPLGHASSHRGGFLSEHRSLALAPSRDQHPTHLLSYLTA